MPDTIIQALREWLATCPYLRILAGDVKIDWLERNPTEYGIFPAGETLTGEDMAGNKTWQYDAAIMMSGFAMEDINRLANSGFMEQFNQWLNSYSRVGFPMPYDCDFIGIKAGNGMMEDVSEDGQSGIYRIMIYLTYERVV